jgi:prepilin-type N-terminal cleavage/methylation domain-containing protein
MQPINSRQPKTEKAFTLIELLVVIAIVGILAGLAVVNMSGATEAARIAKLKVYSNSIRSSLMGNRVSEWRFDEGAGTTTADIVGMNNGILTNFNFSANSNWKTGAECVFDSCLQFDGTDDYVDFGNTVEMNSFTAITVSTWVNVHGGVQYSAFVNKIDSSYKGFALQYVAPAAAGNIRWFGFGNNANLIYTNISLDQWHLLTGTWNGTVMRLFVDGVSIDSKNTVVNSMDSGTNRFKIGELSYGTGYIVNGKIDETRVYNSALTASAIRGQYLAGLDKLLANRHKLRTKTTSKGYRN